jgi:hypothetical protein
MFIPNTIFFTGFENAISISASVCCAGKKEQGISVFHEKGTDVYFAFHTGSEYGYCRGELPPQTRCTMDWKSIHQVAIADFGKRYPEMGEKQLSKVSSNGL